jgi:hypothetical protein
MEFGAGWMADNGWQGDYNPKNTGIHQDYTPGPADLGAAHTYLSNPNQRPVDVLSMLRVLARITTPGKPVAHTEVGAYRSAKLSPETYGRYMVMGAFDSAAAGDAGYLVYGLQDSVQENTYGFYTWPGGKPNPVATYFHNMTVLLKSAKGAYAPGAKPAFRPEPLAATFSNRSAGHLVLQKPTGEFVIAVWSEQLPNGAERPLRETIRFERTFRTIRVFSVTKGTAPVQTLHASSGATLVIPPNETYLLVLSADRPVQPNASGRSVTKGMAH